MDSSDTMTDAVRAMLVQAGFGSAFTVVPLIGGGNNRVFRIDTGGRSLLLKAYFRHPGDIRDRLGTEFAFVSFAWDHGLRCVPRPLACDDVNGLGLYEFLAGRPMQPNDVSPSAVQQAVAFYQELNRHRGDAGHLAAGSEACFCLADHLHCVDRRLARFDNWAATTDVDGSALAFLQTILKPRWLEVRSRIVSDSRMSLDAILPRESRCLSPSDFGFHNALLDDRGSIRFVDFEYAGWDDPAKLVCDFFCQPALPVPMEHWASVVRAVGVDEQRLLALLPVYQCKWVTILLNDFLDTDNQRRRFARPDENAEQRKAAQLDKARGYYQRLV